MHVYTMEQNDYGFLCGLPVTVRDVIDTLSLMVVSESNNTLFLYLKETGIVMCVCL